MKILITGQNSYIGTSFETWAKQQNSDWVIDTIDVRGDEWKTTSFSGYDAILHVAGIAHIKETKGNEDIYYRVNRDLTINLADKAKKDNVNHFIFLSSMSVYGVETGEIDLSTSCHPKTAYGNSKLQAEIAINEIRDSDFLVTILRPPMVYGKGALGNYSKLSKFAKGSPIFPYVNNKRSMIHIDILCQFILIVIRDSLSGTFYPQNSEYVSTSNMVKEITKLYSKHIILIKGFQFLLNNIPIVTLKKVFGSLTYSKSMSSFELDYNVFDFVDTIKRTEDNHD